jgi:hypothetical protein
MAAITFLIAICFTEVIAIIHPARGGTKKKNTKLGKLCVSAPLHTGVK